MRESQCNRLSEIDTFLASSPVSLSSELASAVLTGALFKWWRKGKYVYLHVFVQTVVHDERMTHPNSMRLHRMSRSISIIPTKSVSALLTNKGHIPYIGYTRREKWLVKYSRKEGETLQS